MAKSGQKKKKPKKTLTLADLQDNLFPNTPIEVRFEDGEYHIWVEGEWYERVATVRDVEDQIHNLIGNQGDDWYYPSLRVNPTWHGWDKISRIDLLHFMDSEHKV